MKNLGFNVGCDVIVVTLSHSMDRWWLVWWM